MDKKNGRNPFRQNMIVSEAIIIAILVMALAVVLVLYFHKSRQELSGEVNLAELESFEALERESEETEPEKITEYEYERILLTDPSLKDFYIPTAPDIPRNHYDWNCLKEENGRLSYTSKDYISKLGVDVSYFQGEIDWEKVKSDGIDFAILRLGLRGYGTGNIVIDEKFVENINGALNAGLDVGVYFFSQAITEEEAQREAQTALNMLSTYQLAFPVAYDLEVISESGSRTKDLSPGQMTKNAEAFCAAVTREGYKAAYYAGKKTALLKYDMARLAEYGLWYSDTDPVPDMPYAFCLWQYTTEGTVDGIGCNVSLNLYFEPVQPQDGETVSGTSLH